MNPSELHSIEALNRQFKRTSQRREKHLLGLAVTLTRGCLLLRWTIRKPLPSNSAGTLNATVDLTAVNAGVVVRTALLGIEGNERDESCEDGTALRR